MLESLELTGQTVTLMPMCLRHAPALYEASRDTEIWRYMPEQVETPDDMRRWVQQAVEGQEGGKDLPFVILHRATQSVVGSTRMMDLDFQHRNLEIGWTWLAPEARRTSINTECKLLLLEHGFERLGMIRVMFKTDGRNLRSQRALERIGAVREGVLRHHRIMPDGFLRNSVVYSILVEEWPVVKQHLKDHLSVCETHLDHAVTMPAPTGGITEGSKHESP
ncbi:MAG: GNAT family N-acetyltransferase [Armatimonadetes bacterium]|nr:GNAT family N-acetyltransferase [Armatimonadota bacterium]